MRFFDVVNLHVNVLAALRTVYSKDLYSHIVYICAFIYIDMSIHCKYIYILIYRYIHTFLRHS